jgi:hypothetical protein
LHAEHYYQESEMKNLVIAEHLAKQRATMTDTTAN